MPRQRNVHFLDGMNREVAGFWQNGSVVWEYILEYMHFVLDNPITSYAIFPCLETDSPQNRAEHHGPFVSLTNNQNIVDVGYYVVLAEDGE
jgi:hypothetical protein